MAFELRVHGVFGAGPEGMLDRPLVTRVAGDEDAGFYRPRTEYGDTTGPSGAVLEAYRWANLTRSTVSRAVWLLLLLPFLLSNLMMWMRPATSGSGAAAKALCRVFAATLTAVFVLAAVGLSLDLIAWQCASDARCVDGRPYLAWLVHLAPGQRLALLSVVPIVAIHVLWFLGSRTWRSYEAFGSRFADTGPDRLDAVARWDGMAVVGRLRSIHVAIAFATLDASLLAVLAPHDRRAAGYALIGAAAALLAACLVMLCLPAVVERGAADGRMDMIGRRLRMGAMALTAVTLAYAAAPRAHWTTTGPLPRYGASVAWLFAAEETLLLALAAVVLWERRRRPQAPTVLGGLAAPAVGFLAIGVGIAFSAGLIYRLADFLDRGEIPTPSWAAPVAAKPLQPPLVFEWAAVTAIALVLATSLTALCTALVTRHRRRRDAAEITRRDFPDAPPEAAPRVHEVCDTIAKAQVTEWLWAVLAAYVAVDVVGKGLMSLALIEVGPVNLTAHLIGDRKLATLLVADAVNIGTYLVGLLALGLVVVGLLAYRYTGIRRIVGALWDVGTFWPRAAHPLGPPCYAERVVPELTTRARCLAEQGGVVLSGHSNGAVLLAATVLQLPPEVLPRVALLTYGSPLCRLYARLFPAYVTADVLCEVGDRVGWRWLNLWRDTDSIGGWVFSPNHPGEPPRVSGPPAEVDWRLRDPRGLTVPECDTVPPPIEGHLRYQADPRFNDAVRELLARMGPPPG